jgi:hypothetical protein
VLTDCSRSGSAVGERLVPGADVAHFCKPTHVAVLADGSFFVADGYCNSRVLRFDARGAFLSELSSQTRQVHGPPLHVISRTHVLMQLISGYCNSRVLWFDARGAFLSELSSQTRQVHGPPLHVIRQNSLLMELIRGFLLDAIYQQTKPCHSRSSTLRGRRK